MYRIIRNLNNQIIRRILLGKKFKVENSILIISDPRGGSTWLMELLSNIPSTCVNWEPLHEDFGVVPKEYKLGWKPYLSKNDEDIKYLTMFKMILEFSLSSDWTRRYLSISKIIKSKYVITKFVRANLLLPYLLKNFNFNYPPILLLRHPIDVGLSQLKAFHSDNNKVAKITIPNCINNERYVANYDFLNRLETQLEVLIAEWCLSNVSLLNNLEDDILIIVFYNDLVKNPQLVMNHILDKFNLRDQSEKIIKDMNFRRPSRMTFQEEFKSKPDEQLMKNFNNLSEDTKISIQKIFDHFDFKLYNAFSPFPKKQYLTLRNTH